MKELSYFAIRLKKARKQANMSAAEAGALINRSDSTIYAYESDNAEPNAEQLLTLCRAYGVEISYFYPPEYSTPWRGLSDDERKLLEGYRKMTEEGKSIVLALVDYRGEVK